MLGRHRALQQVAERVLGREKTGRVARWCGLFAKGPLVQGKIPPYVALVPFLFCLAFVVLARFGLAGWLDGVVCVGDLQATFLEQRKTSGPGLAFLDRRRWASGVHVG